MKYLVLLVAGVMGYGVYQRLQEQYGDGGFDATELTGEECSEVELSVTVDPTREGEPWDADSPPDIAFQADSRWTAVCHDTLTCKLPLKLRVPAKRIELRIWDRDEKDKISGDEAKTELIGHGWLTIDQPEGALGAARVRAECLN
jgi:hypothetical protein